MPNGTVLVEELEKLAKETEFAAGYVRVKTPHLAKESMYKTSGHLPYYAESMFPPMHLLEEQDRVKHETLSQRKFAILDELVKLKGAPGGGDPERIKALEQESFELKL